MKRIFKGIIWLLFLACISSICYGFYLKNAGNFDQGEFQIGFGALGLTFAVMPLFIVYRYAKKDSNAYKYAQKTSIDENKL